MGGLNPSLESLTSVSIRARILVGAGRQPSAPMPGSRVAAPAHTCMRRQAMFDEEEACDINHVKRISPWRPCRAKRGKRRRSPFSHRKRHRKHLQTAAVGRRTTKP